MMITLEKIYKSFRMKGKDFSALTDVSLSLPSSSLVLLSGKSGSGKTTLLNIIGGLDAPSSGRMLLNDKEIAKKNVDDYRANNVGIVFQDYNLINDATVKENLLLAFGLKGQKPDDNELQKTLSLVSLPDENENPSSFLDKKPMELSGGQRQRVAIARALVKKPSVLLLDEPTGAIDKENATSLLKLLKKISSTCLVIVSTHDLDLALPYADRVIFLKKGRIISDEIKAEPGENNTAAKVTKKGRLPFLYRLKIALRGVKHQKVRLVTSLMLSVIATAGLGLLLSVSTSDTDKVVLRSQYEQNNKSMVFIESRENYFSTAGETDQHCSFSTDQREKIAAYSEHGSPIYLSWIDFGVAGYSPWDIITRNNPFIRLATFNRNLAIEVDPITGLKDAGLERDPRLDEKTECRLPDAFDEIALTDFQAQFLLKRGYVNYEVSKEVKRFKSIDELIGFKVGDFTVTGIYKTEEELSEWLKYDIDDYQINNGNEAKEMYLASGFSEASFPIVKKGFAESKSLTQAYAMVKLSGSLSTDIALRDGLTFDVDSHHYYVHFWNSYSGLASKLSFINGIVEKTLYVVATALALISALLSLNFFFSNVKGMEKEFGILRAMGSSKATIASIVAIQGSGISLLELGLALIVTAIGNSIINANLYISILSLNAVSVLSMLALVFVMMALVSLMASRRALKQKPINVIEGK